MKLSPVKFINQNVKEWQLEEAIKIGQKTAKEDTESFIKSILNKIIVSHIKYCHWFFLNR